MEFEQSFLGTGWSFPPEFSKTSRLVMMRTGEADIKESLAVILTTRIGERVMDPQFGCNLEEALFSPLDLTLKTYASGLIRDAILYYEPRIDVNFIDITQGDDLGGLLLIEIDYTIRATNSRTNMVYPYYKTEGTNI